MKTIKFKDIAKFSYGTMPNKNLINNNCGYPIFSGYLYDGFYDTFNTNENTLIIIARGVGGTGDVKYVRQKCWLTNLSIRSDIISDEVIPKYLYYKFIHKNLRYLNSGSAQFQITIKDLENLNIILHDLSIQQHIVDSIGSVDDAIEKNEEIMSSFQKYIESLYLTYAAKTKETIKLSNLITKSGTLLKNSEWHNERVIDLSTMPQDNICIITDSNGADFSTNIKTLEDNTLLYGSIRPYFKKCGFTVNHSYVAGTIHTFKVIDEKYFTYILATICSDGFHNYTNTNSQGTKMPIINWETFVNYDVPLVSKNELNDFYCKTVDIYNYIKILMNKTMILKLLKQTLLNKYFS